MKNSIALIVLACVAGIAGSANAGEQSEIAAAAMENTRTAEVLRLVVTPKLSQFEEDIICAEGMIRVRLDGISNRGRKIQELSVPSGGPIRRARIIEKNPSNTVIQLFPRRNPQGTCSRTTATAVGGEIIVSTAYTDAEAARLFPRKPEKRAPSTPPVASAAVLPIRTPAADPTASDNRPDKNEKASAGEDSGLLFKDEKPKSGGNSDIGFSESPISTPKAAFGFGFAATLAGIAIYLKRKKKFSPGRMDQIDILSTQRLGVRQQLMLVSVQDVKFLLAVSDKTVSSLGVVPEETASRALPAPKANAPMSVESTLESLIAEASKRAAEKHAVPVETKEQFGGFDSELRRALDHTQINNDRPVEKSPTARFDSASNAAGLVALARMRANLKKSTGKSQVFEA